MLVERGPRPRAHKILDRAAQPGFTFRHRPFRNVLLGKLEFAVQVGLGEELEDGEEQAAELRVQVPQGPQQQRLLLHRCHLQRTR